MLGDVTAVLGVLHAAIARKYADMTLENLADGLTVPVLLSLWPTLLTVGLPARLVAARASQWALTTPWSRSSR